MSKVKSRPCHSQVSVMDFAPVQETGNNILEMVSRVANLKNKNLESPEYKTLVSRIKTQAFCLQGILSEDGLGNSIQAQRMIETFESIKTAKKTNILVKNCLEEILPIIRGNRNLHDEIKYVPVIPSSEMTHNFFKSMNHIENQMELAKNDPEEYKRQDKLGMHDNSLKREKIIKEFEDTSDIENIENMNVIQSEDVQPDSNTVKETTEHVEMIINHGKPIEDKGNEDCDENGKGHNVSGESNEEAMDIDTTENISDEGIKN